MNKICLIILTYLVSCSALAAKSKTPVSELELGVITTSGNTNTQSYKGKLDLRQEVKAWHNHFIVEGLSKRDEVEVTSGDETRRQDQTTAEKYFASAKSNYKFRRDHAALFFYAEYDRNRFSGFDYQYTLAMGYSNRLFTSDRSHLAYDLGPGYTVDQPEDIDGERQDKEDSVIARIAAEYFFQISDNAKFTQTVSSNYNPDTDRNSKTKAVSALTAQINSALALRASYTLDYNSVVPPERDHADTETALTVVYSF